MKTITIRELHLETTRWIRYAAAHEPVVVTDRGRGIATLQPIAPDKARQPLPDREATIQKRSRIPVDSAAYVAIDRGRRQRDRRQRP